MKIQHCYIVTMSGFLESFLPIVKPLQKYKIELVLSAIALTAAFTAGIIFFQNLNNQPSVSVEETTTAAKNNGIMVEVAGAVNKPNVYEVTSSARLKDIIDLAGGLSAEADLPYFHRNFNLAKIVTDQEKIYIPSVTDTYTNPGDQNQPTTVNLNQATIQELDGLPGIGSTTAQKIIQNRPYGSVEELLNKKIVNKNVYEQIKELISL